jgi:Abortive infection C-terminus
MTKLRELIKEYGKWSPLIDYILRIETYMDSDFGIAIENSKSILESISKEICDDKGVILGSSESISGVLKKACEAIGYTSADIVTQFSRSIANIGQQLGNLRNEKGSTSHGRTMNELKARNEGIDHLTKRFLVDTTELVSCFLIMNFENENPRIEEDDTEQVEYLNAEDFNEFWDESFGEFPMGDYSYPASEILFNVDNTAYTTEFKVFNEIKEGEE